MASVDQLIAHDSGDKPTLTFEQLIEQLYEVFSRDCVNVDQVKALLAAYKSDRKDWKKFAKFDAYRYTRNLMDSGNGKFNLMALCWGEGHGSSIHDHADAHCFVKVLEGKLKETLYAWPSESNGEDQMVKLEEHIFETNGVTYINDELGLHRMENPSHSDKTVSMHLYIPAFDSCTTFDEKTGHTNTVRVTFYSKYGQRTPVVMMCGSCLPRHWVNSAITGIFHESSGVNKSF